MEILSHCYNKGCGKKFDPENNGIGSCKYHPGGPIFHDALKGWSCCKKKSTDFTEFLSIPGCTTGEHSNEKPPKPVVVKAPDNSVKEEVVIVKAPLVKDVKARQCVSESYANDKLKPLKMIISMSLRSALDKLSLESTNKNCEAGDSEDQEVKIGTSCKNNACNSTFEGESSNEESCTSHPGQPIFHEGMKFWSCCQRKTSDFDNFLAQEGCNITKHVWVKQKVEGEESKSCRYDWHQTTSNVCISIFAKTALPEKCSIDANKATCKLHLVFDGGKSVFDNTFHFSDIIVPEKSEVKMLGTKVELNLKKHDCFSWPLLERTSKFKDDPT